ncbi:MAG: DNA-processing protein DprA [Syntrophales bacterium]|jgi:DNA processing protein|nr:DNA-processing protein DprA [Syntrophales bacterium]MDY0045010.1 DNA-processing protein DprA [Syntrophales bacterium]
MRYEELKHLIALTIIDEIGPVIINRLIASAGSPSAVFQSSCDLSKIRGVTSGIETRIKSFSEWSRVEREYESARMMNVSLITAWDDEYPQLLRHIYDPPPLLYVKGDLHSKDLNIAIVGSRNASAHGMYLTDKLSRELAVKGLTVVSGMARGIDSAAHTGALAAKGRTTAVLGSGIDIIYPPENKKLFEKIIANGAVITEHPFGTSPKGQHFPRRNRIISGTSLGVIVAEAAEKSGSLITARIALEQGREVFAIPGSIDSVVSKGTNKLIKDGAKLVQNIYDILDEILPQIDFSDNDTGQNPGKTTATTKNFHPSEKLVIGHISERPIHIDTLIVKSGVAVQELLDILLKLEVKGCIEQLPGRYFRLKL